MRRPLFIALASVLALSVASGALANDGAFGGSGVHPMPLNNTDVRMVDEIVTLRLDPAADAWQVRCSFIFENTSDEAVKVTIGFPFPVVDADMEYVLPKGVKRPKPSEPLVWDFTTEVRGQRVKARRGETAVNPDKPDMVYGFAYLWDVTFAPGERVHIVNTYRHGVSAVVGGLKFANYVVRSGTTWKGGAIGHARLSVEVPTDRWIPCPDSETGDEGFARPAGAAVSPLHGEPGFAVHWSIPNFAPTEDVQVCFMDLDGYRQMHFHTQMTDVDLDSLDAAGLRLLRNTIYALHGHRFEDAALRAHFAAQWWYRPDPTFTPKRLSREERELIQEIQAKEKALTGTRR